MTADLPPVEELSADEGRALFDQVARHELDMTGAEFLTAYDRGDFDGRDESAVVKVSMLIPFARDMCPGAGRTG
jgi:hypothetical protein